MYEKIGRTGLVVHLYYNRDAKKLAAIGDIVYHSKKRRYLQLYVDSQQAESLMEELAKERYIKQVRLCHIQELDTDFVGNLYRN